MHVIKLGNKVVVSDPCYTLDTWCQAILDNVLPGNYHCSTEEMDGRTSRLVVIHEDFVNKHLYFVSRDEEIGVDSGQAGVFSIDSYRDDNWNLPGKLMFGPDWSDKSGDNWYQKICDNGSYDEGFCVSSGYGDGGYPLEVSEEDGKIVAFSVTFIDDDNYEEDFDDNDWDPFKEEEE